MGGSDTPHAYSTQLGGNGQSGWQADGYNVVIDPDQLQSSITTFKQGLAGKGPADMINTIMSALIAQDAFGQLPNAESAYGEVLSYVQAHAAAMNSMGVSLEDFVARVQAAAQFGYEADPVTKQAAAAAQRHHGPMMAQ